MTEAQRFDLLLCIEEAIAAVNVWQRYGTQAESPYWASRRDRFQELFDLVNGARP